MSSVQQQTSPRKILVTSALPYANGSLHLGHILETIQTGDLETSAHVRITYRRKNPAPSERGISPYYLKHQ